MAFKINVKEITQNPAFKEQDITEMAFYVKQTLERYLEMVNNGYLDTESRFEDDEIGSMITTQFDPNKNELVEYAQSFLLRNLRQIYEFCFVTKDKKKYLYEHFIDINNGLDMFYAETIAPCLSYESLVQHGVLETQYSSDSIHRFFIIFIANLKMAFGDSSGFPYCLHEPDEKHLHLELPYEHIESLGLHLEHFSFRELTLLSGYQTERAVRNLASPSTPEHRKLSVVKKGRSTFVTREEAIRWLNSLNRK
ncbi:hypothetical protein ACOMICROBIO_FLGHMIGD_01753 [Vibrio sp. B1FLJ16]|uniref:hypothetical protein n=1 Tax=Vibrio sp. B1FLJ16 TaxID=2751178 RepID=UPI0015F52FD9|nr:hypothetical protein [Vibrio sp. B1FLJ16]CAD7807942.1 hypothetical protein ACOMICROBIO_FLGHMIGD_01753 [Vibrio sp. B1FLJ16]CAE6905853.1 hypothetical protein ACOMICROBIO_FLGHMIGD_01753 [Vibrio sp. B1FLJ16]